MERKPQIGLLLSELLYLIAVLYLVDEDLGGLKAGDEMLVDYDGSIARDVARDFFLSLLVNKTAKSADINILAA